MNNNNADRENGSAGEKPKKPFLEFDMKEGVELGETLEAGLGAIKGVLGGFFNMAQELLGPEGMKNLEAARWLAHVAASLDDLATSLADDSLVPVGKAGELTCFLERVDDELDGSKFATQAASIEARLKEAAAIANDWDRAAPAESRNVQLERINNSVGYLRAAAAVNDKDE
jgi:hypothetical protein